MGESSMDSNFISIRPAVEFINILDHYSYNEDLNCQYKFNDYVPQEGDRIAIFRLGWNFVKDYIVFEWAPTGSKNGLHSVIFNRHVLPKNHSEIYQICYISGDNELHGASSSFQFSAVKDKSQSFTTMQYQKIPEPKTLSNQPLGTQETNEEIKKLISENIMLRETLNLIISKKNNVEESKNDYQKEIEALKEKVNIMSLSFSHAVLNLNKEADSKDGRHIHRNYDKDIEDLLCKVNNLETLYNSQQAEIDMLKSKIIECGEEYKKIYLEKVKLEKKMEKLKNKKDEIKQDPNSFNIEDLKTLPPFPFPKKI